MHISTERWSVLGETVDTAVYPMDSSCCSSCSSSVCCSWDDDCCCVRMELGVNDDCGLAP